MPRKRRTTRRRPRPQRAEEAWKWLLRLSALAAFFYVLVAKDGDVPLGVYVLIGGMAGLPNIWGLQQALGADDESEIEE